MDPVKLPAKIRILK